MSELRWVLTCLIAGIVIVLTAIMLHAEPMPLPDAIAADLKNAGGKIDLASGTFGDCATHQKRRSVGGPTAKALPSPVDGDLLRGPSSPDLGIGDRFR